MRYPDIPGHNYVTTSIAAADTVISKALAIRQRVYSLLLNGNEITSQEASERLGVSHDNAWKRFSELRAKGLAEDSGVRRTNTSGRAAIVWRLRAEDGTDIEYRQPRAPLQATIDRLQKEVDRLNAENEHLRNVTPALADDADQLRLFGL